MKETIKSRFTGILIMLAAAAVFGAAVMLLWNALLPRIFTLPQINYPQAVGLLVMTRLLFGGIGGWMHGHRGRGEGHLFQHGNKLREKWMNMSEEERKEFIEKEKDFFKSRASHLKDFFDGKERPE
jgi:hypothetical protein